jgi:hypothetical protein
MKLSNGNTRATTNLSVKEEEKTDTADVDVETDLKMLEAIKKVVNSKLYDITHN